jgi:hypothetical protein
MARDTMKATLIFTETKSGAVDIKIKHIILSEVSLAQKTKNPMFSLICGH